MPLYSTSVEVVLAAGRNLAVLTAVLFGVCSLDVLAGDRVQ